MGCGDRVQGVARQFQDGQAGTGAVEVVNVAAIIDLPQIRKDRIPAVIRITLVRPTSRNSISIRRLNEIAVTRLGL